MRSDVPDGTRDESIGELVHDDLLVSAALCYALDGLGMDAVVETQYAASQEFVLVGELGYNSHGEPPR